MATNSNVSEGFFKFGGSLLLKLENPAIYPASTFYPGACRNEGIWKKCHNCINKMQFMSWGDTYVHTRCIQVH